MEAQTKEKEEMKIAKIPVVGWLVGVVVLLGLLSWNLFQAMRLAQQRLILERRIQSLARGYQKKRDKFSKLSKDQQTAINVKASKKMTKLLNKKTINIMRAQKLKGASDLANEVFGAR